MCKTRPEISRQKSKVLPSLNERVHAVLLPRQEVGLNDDELQLRVNSHRKRIQLSPFNRAE